jgi:N-acetyl sugar amidotransferase
MTVVDTAYPGVTFDREGISSVFWDFQQKTKPYWHSAAKGRELIDAQLDEVRKRSKNNEFDCVLGLSGGLDSSYMLHIAVKEFGLRPLVFHVDGGWNSEVAVHNINALVQGLGVDLYTEVINWNEMRDFQLAMFKAGVPHLDIPQDHAFVAVLYKFCEENNIKTILNGGNISTECVHTPLEYFYWGTDLCHIQAILREFGTVPMQSYPFSSVFRHKLYLRYIRGVRVLKLLNFIDCPKKKMIETLVHKYGWKPYQQKHFESRFTRFYEGYWLPSRFGFDIRQCQLSSLILTGQLTREEALIELEKPALDDETVSREFDYIAAKLEIGTDELRQYHGMPKKFFRNYENRHRLLGLMGRLAELLNVGRRGGAY